MQIVIDIPTDKLELLINNPSKTLLGEYQALLENDIYQAIRKGVVLPKGHGRLVDVTLAYQDTMIYSERTRKMIMGIIDRATVLEADKGE